MTTPKLTGLLRRYAETATAESAFWQGVVAKASGSRPNWGVDLNPGRGPLALDAYVYLADTSNLWLKPAAIDPAHLEKLLAEDGFEREVQGQKRARAADCIDAASLAGAGAGASTPDGPSSPELIRAFATSLIAIAASPAYAKARQAPASVTGGHHWFLILYRLADGGRVAGLGHVIEPEPGMLNPASALDCLESIVQMDLGSPQTLVHKAVANAGGLHLAAALQHVKVA